MRKEQQVKDWKQISPIIIEPTHVQKFANKSIASEKSGYSFSQKPPSQFDYQRTTLYPKEITHTKSAISKEVERKIGMVKTISELEAEITKAKNRLEEQKLNRPNRLENKAIIKEVESKYRKEENLRAERGRSAQRSKELSYSTEEDVPKLNISQNNPIQNAQDKLLNELRKSGMVISAKLKVGIAVIFQTLANALKEPGALTSTDRLDNSSTETVGKLKELFENLNQDQEKAQQSLAENTKLVDKQMEKISICIDRFKNCFNPKEMQTEEYETGYITQLEEIEKAVS